MNLILSSNYVIEKQFKKKKKEKQFCWEQILG